MSEKAPNQASSKEDLRPLSALEESIAPFGMGDLDAEHGVILKDWSAQDFANIYVRFRPHLISHARKFVREETQAEEVVQDAFLYLMTALPELDSELGVLKFLKWKTKMLCLDIIRSSQAGLNNNLVPLPDDVADEAQPLDSLERADDAAIIRLALAKLNPRHREALIATMYEEKSHEEVAQQMGVGENAFRQLLFRARSSFRKALVGEAEVEGRSVSEILSIAASKNSAVSKGAASAFIAVAVLMTMTFLGASTPPTSEIAASSSDIRFSQIIKRPFVTGTEVDARPGADTENSTDVGPATYQASWDQETLAVSDPVESESGDGQIDTRVAEANDSRPLDIEQSVRLASEFNVALTGFGNSPSKTFVEGQGGQGSLVFEAEGGIQLGFILSDNTEQPVAYSWMTVETPSGTLVAVPSNGLSFVSETGTGNIEIFYGATDLILGDLSGALGNLTVEQSDISSSKVSARFVISPTGELIDSQIVILPLKSTSQIPEAKP